MRGEISTARRRPRRGMPPWGRVFLALVGISLLIFSVLFVQSWSEISRVPARLVAERVAQLGLLVAVLAAGTLLVRHRRVPWALLALVAGLGVATAVLMTKGGPAGRPNFAKEGEAIFDRLRTLPLEQEVDLTDAELEAAGSWRPAIEAFGQLHRMLRRTVEPLVDEVDRARRGRSAVIDELVMVDPLERARVAGRLGQIAGRVKRTEDEVRAIRDKVWDALGVSVRGSLPMVRGGAAGQAVMGHLDDLVNALRLYRGAVGQAGSLLKDLKGKDVGCSATRLSLPPRELQRFRYRFEEVFRRQRALARIVGGDPARLRLMNEWRLEQALAQPTPTRRWGWGSRRRYEPQPTPTPSLWEEFQ